MKSTKILYEDLKAVNAPYFNKLSEEATRTIENGWYVLGESVKKFELKFGEIHNNSFCIGVASGLDALVLGLAVFDFPKGSKVLVPSNTYIASILAIIQAGLVPVLVEPDPFTYNLTVEELEKKYDKSCVAILAVHLYGRLCPMVEILEFAKSNKLKVVEDCAQAHFANFNGVKAGEFGDIGAFSFYPTKNLGAIGDAGAILCKDMKIYEKLLALRNYGSHQKYYNKYIGWNSRLDEIQAGFLLIKLENHENVYLHKQKLANIYLENLKEISSIQLPAPAKQDHVWHIFNILSNERDILKQKLLEYSIHTEIHYPVAPNLQEGYRALLNGHYPISEKIHLNTLSLPISTCHTEEDIYYVINCIKKIVN
jgi:dTDP-4-amino-4,6-dideoxygalactose transaminase